MVSEIKKKKTCSTCKRLHFYDWYLCEKGKSIGNPELEHCKYYKKRHSSFWLK